LVLQTKYLSIHELDLCVQLWNHETRSETGVHFAFWLDVSHYNFYVFFFVSFGLLHLTNITIITYSNLHDIWFWYNTLYTNTIFLNMISIWNKKITIFWTLFKCRIYTFFFLYMVFKFIVDYFFINRNPYLVVQRKPLQTHSIESKKACNRNII